MAAKSSYSDINGKNKPTPKPGKVGGVDNAEFKGYINLNLSDDEKAAWATWAQTDGPIAVFELNASEGVNFSTKRDPKSGGYISSATQRDPASVNAGYVVTARARSAFDSLTRVLFCLGILSRTECWTDTQPPANSDRW